MKKTVLGVVWLFAVGFGAAADEPKTDEVQKKAVDKALETFAGTWEIVAAKRKGSWIYELNGDTLKVYCVTGTWNGKQWTGKPRPTEFRLPVADVVLELRRIKTE